MIALKVRTPWARSATGESPEQSAEALFTTLLLNANMAEGKNMCTTILAGRRFAQTSWRPKVKQQCLQLMSAANKPQNGLQVGLDRLAAMLPMHLLEAHSLSRASRASTSQLDHLRPLQVL